jgi:hypothetical protein
MILRALPFVALALVATPVAAKTTILPGLWESTSTSSFIVDSKPKTERRCITPDKVDQYINSPSTSHYHCAYTKHVVADGRADFVGQCFDKHHRTYEVSLHGEYAPEAFHIKASFMPNGLPFGGTAQTVAHRIGDCPGA